MFAPQKLQPTAPKPDDFDAFWDAHVKQLHAIPENPQITPADGGKPGVDYFLVRLDNIADTHIYGQLAKPQKEGKFPAIMILQWAGGPYPLQKQWVTDRAAEGWLAFNIEPHDLPGDQPASYYSALPAEIKNFQSIGQDDKEKSYFLRMYLSAYRAIDYLSERPEWDGKTLVVMGTSMGGQQTLVMAGLHPKVTAGMACVPSSCDVTGPLHGRAAGFPDWAREAASKKNDQIVETGRYFDPVNFAARVKVPMLISMGFIDETCPPTGAWTALNLMQGPVEALPLINSAHQETPAGHEQKPYQTRSAEWLAALIKGEPLSPNESIAKPKSSVLAPATPAAASSAHN
jgi:cephalosporin-C deacetylase-like acetyl esterase